MTQTAQSPDERGRLDALGQHRILDTPAERIFDDLTELAAQFCGSPVSLLGFVDDKREWFKSHFGWNISNMPRDLSFASRTILEPDLLVVADALADPRFSAHPLVISEPYIRFYAGMPLLTADGFALGAISVLDRVPRQLNSQQREAMRALARQVMAHLDARRNIGQVSQGSSDVEMLREALQDSDERFKDLFENTDDLIMSIGSDGRLMHVNSASLRALAYTAEELTRRPVTELMPADVVADFRFKFDRIMAAGKSERIETDFLTKYGARFTVEGGLNPKVIMGKAALARVIFRDISERKRYEVEIGQARDAALESARLKAQFLTNVSHEIRTPMNGIVGMLELLLDSPLTTEQKEYGQTALSSADQLLAIINNIIHMSKIEAGKLSVAASDFDVVTTVERVVEVMRILAETKDLSVTVFFEDGLPTVLRGDVSRIRQVLTNLLDNSIKFTETGRIVVRVGSEAETDTHLMIRFAVSDTGAGIPEEVRPRLFKSFSQGDGSLTRQHGGVGLGLATSKQLVELMGGIIGFESEVDSGSTFWFTIPFEKRISESVMVVATQLDLVDTRVLVLDQSETSRKIINHYLSSWSLRAAVATSPTEALTLLREEGAGSDPFRLAIFDYRMPGMDGASFARAVKGDPVTKAVGLVMMTSLGERVDDQAVRAAGISAYLSKPVEQSELFDSLTAALAREASKNAMSIQAPVAAQPQRVPAAAPARPDQVRIMLAEDNLLNQKLTLSQLQKLGYTAHAVSNGKEVLEAMTKGSYDIILMDCQMPMMDGYEATMEIRRLEGGNRRTAIIAMTAHALEGDREKCLAAGMDDYLSKPTKHDELASTLARWVTQQQTG